MLNRFYRTAFWSIVLTALTDQVACSLPVVPVPTAPSLTAPDSQRVPAIDEPLCFIRISSGNAINLEHLCGKNAATNQRDRIEAARTSSPNAVRASASSSNPVRFGAGRSYAEDAR